MKKIEVSPEDIENVKQYLIDKHYKDEALDALVDYYIETRTTLTRMRAGSVYNKGILEIIKLNNPNRIEQTGGYYILSVYDYNVIKRGFNWWEKYLSKASIPEWQKQLKDGMSPQEILDLLEF